MEMTSTINLKASEEVIRQNIVPNGVKAITAELLQDVLLNITVAAEQDIVDSVTSAFSSLEDFVFTTANYGNLSVTTPKIANGAVTAEKLDDGSINKAKLTSDVTDYLLTPIMKEYLLSKINTDLQVEAQEKFSGNTENYGDTVFVYGETSKAAASKKVVVSLTFDGVQVEADNVPCGWNKSGMVYEYNLSLDGGNTVVPATIFTYTPKTGKYSGYTVTYESKAASVEWTNPIYYGFVPENSESRLTTSLISQMTYSTEDVINPSASIRNYLANEGYFCILTKNVATASQLGISILDCAKNAPNFMSPKNSSVTMTGYTVYFSKNKVSAGATLGNVNLSILK